MTWRTRFWWSISFLLVSGFIFAAGVKVHFRVLGRHFTPIMPLVAFVLGSGLSSFLERRNLQYRLLLGLYLAFSLISCGLLRFSQRHAKEDYREAARLAREALSHGQIVWWNADNIGASVYQVPIATSEKTNMALLLVNPSSDFENRLRQPDLVLISKPDLFDQRGEVRRYLVRERFSQTRRLTAFSTWAPTNGVARTN